MPLLTAKKSVLRLLLFYLLTWGQHCGGGPFLFLPQNVYQASFDHIKVSPKPFFLPKRYFFWICHFLDFFWNILPIGVQWDPLEDSRTKNEELVNLWRKKYLAINEQNLAKVWSSNPKDLVLEITEKHFSCSEHISLEAICIWPRLQFSGERLMHQLRSTIIFPKMFSLKC